jgi:hypothetical protein
MAGEQIVIFWKRGGNVPDMKLFFGQLLDRLRKDGAARVHHHGFTRGRGNGSIWPFSRHIMSVSTMRYHDDLQWVSVASRNVSRTAVRCSHRAKCHVCFNGSMSIGLSMGKMSRANETGGLCSPCLRVLRDSELDGPSARIRYFLFVFFLVAPVRV